MCMCETRKVRILFLCSGNSCRSQMAEGWTRALHGDKIEAYSAGVNATAVDPRAIEVMREVGVDISGQRSKTIDAVAHIDFDAVITLCDHARESCPIFPRRTLVLHRSFDDPPYLAREAANEEEMLQHYRRVREEIRMFVLELPTILEAHGLSVTSRSACQRESGS